MNILKSLKADLHLHTTASDGLRQPAELVRLAAKTGLDVIAITDHDTVEGVPSALQAVTDCPHLCVIPGVEISTDMTGGEVHILGYFVDFKSQDVLANLEGLRDSREKRARRMLERLDGLGMIIGWEELMSIAGESAIGRPHVAQALLKAGYVSTFQEAFDKYIGRGGPAYVEHKKMKPVEVVKFLRKNDSVPVLAHPDNIDSLSALVPELKDAGLLGIEIYYNGYTGEAIDRLLALADKYGLIPTGGSDYHGFSDKPENMIGEPGLPMSCITGLFEMGQRLNSPLLDRHNIRLPDYGT